MSQLVYPEFCPSLLSVGLEGLYLLQAEGEFVSIRFQVAKVSDIGLDPVVAQIFYHPFKGSAEHPFFS
jgi:hypothetical protein